MSKKTADKQIRPSPSQSECTIPPALPKDELHKLLFGQSEQEAQAIKEYVEWQARRDEKVQHAESW